MKKIKDKYGFFFFFSTGGYIHYVFHGFLPYIYDAFHGVLHYQVLHFGVGETYPMCLRASGLCFLRDFTE